MFSLVPDQSAAGLQKMPAEVEFRAGKMMLNSKLLSPDTRKGMVRLGTNAEDGLLHLTWTSRESRVTEDDRILFPGTK